jgi:hypothetical protein
VRTLLFALVVTLVLFGAVGYRFRDRLGGYYPAGAAYLALLVVILLLLGVHVVQL